MIPRRRKAQSQQRVQCSRHVRIIQLKLLKLLPGVVSPPRVGTRSKATAGLRSAYQLRASHEAPRAWDGLRHRLQSRGHVERGARTRGGLGEYMHMHLFGALARAKAGYSQVSPAAYDLAICTRTTVIQPPPRVQGMILRLTGRIRWTIKLYPRIASCRACSLQRSEASQRVS